MILDAWGWCTEMTQRDGMGREEGGAEIRLIIFFAAKDGEVLY